MKYSNTHIFITVFRNEATHDLSLVLILRTYGFFDTIASRDCITGL